MTNYSDWKDKNARSPILEALNRGTQSSVSSFGSVDQFIQGLLGPNFIKDKNPRKESIEEKKEEKKQKLIHEERAKIEEEKEIEKHKIQKEELEKQKILKEESEKQKILKEELEKESISSLNYSEEEEKEEIQEMEDIEDLINPDDKSEYKVYRDKEEIFECNISIQGAKISNTVIRLVFDHAVCNLVFYGKILKDGKCLVPLKKMELYPERSTGKVRLEVVVEDTLFVPWEETFIVEKAKKVTVQIKPQKKINMRS